MEYKPGAINHDSTNQPFMSNSVTKDFIIDSSLNLLLDKIPISDEIKNFYRRFGSSNQEIIRERWTFFPPLKITGVMKRHMADNIKTIDLAFEYIGMGWVNVAFYYPPENKILFRRDGGSNDWDRKDNYDDSKNFDLEKFKEGLSFADLLEIIENGNAV